MFFLHQYDITIGQYRINEIESLKIRSSWRDLTDTAEIVLPRNLTYNEKRIDEVIKRTDQVTITLGHNGGNWVTEFEGYVREVEPNTPVVVYCEDEMMKLKRGVVNKAWRKVSLEEIVRFVVSVANPTHNYQFEIENATLSYVSRNRTAAQVLYDLRDFGIHSYFRKVNGVQTLFCGFPYRRRFDQHILHMQKNVQQNNLKFRTSTEVGLRVKAISNLPTGRKTIEFFPREEDESAEQITINFGEISSDENERRRQLRAFAEAEHNKYKIDGYRGDVVLWKIPYIKHGDQVIIQDALYPEREGNYLVDSTILESAEPYVKRTVELGLKVSV
jgi:hypothetical protein